MAEIKKQEYVIKDPTSSNVLYITTSYQFKKPHVIIGIGAKDIRPSLGFILEPKTLKTIFDIISPAIKSRQEKPAEKTVLSYPVVERVKELVREPAKVSQPSPLPVQSVQQKDPNKVREEQETMQAVKDIHAESNAVAEEVHDGAEVEDNSEDNMNGLPELPEPPLGDSDYEEDFINENRQ